MKKLADFKFTSGFIHWLIFALVYPYNMLTVVKSAIRTPLAEIWLDKEGILHVRPLKESAEVDLEEARSCFAVYRQLGCDKKKVLQLIHASRHMTITKEARDYAARHGEEFFIASAVISDSAAIRLIVNFFNNFYKTRVPLKMFAREEQAIRWLRKFRNLGNQ